MRKQFIAGALVVTLAVLGAIWAVGNRARGDDSDAQRVAAAPSVGGWGDTRMPYRAGSGRFCEVAAEGTSIRPDVVNRLVFLQPDDARLLIAELRARDLELVTVASTELKADLDAIAQAAGRLYDGLEAGGFKLDEVPDDVLMSLSARDLRPAFERARPSSRNNAISTSGASCPPCD
jgi:hypothetical protein